MSTPHVVNQGR